MEPKYQPFSQQKRFHDDRYDVFARLVSAATGGGKTACGLAEALYWTLECPGSVGLILEPTYGMLNRILLGDAIPSMLDSSLEACPLVRQFRRDILMAEWENGSRWWLLSLEEPERVEGPNIDWIWADEYRLVGGSGPVAQPKQTLAWQSLIRRLRGSTEGRRKGYPVGIWVTTTPDQPGSVLHTHFEDSTNKFYVKDSRVYRWDLNANIKLREEWRKEVIASYPPDSGLYKRFVKGLFAEVGGITFAFDGTKHILEQRPRPGFFKTMIYGVDYGWTNPAAIVAIGFDGDGRAYIVDEYYQARESLETQIQEGKRMVADWGSGQFICDRSAPQNIDAMQKAGLLAVADESKREEGINELSARFPDAGDGRPRIFVYKGCVNTISEFQSYDEQVKANDHATDATRYALSYGRRGPASAVWRELA